MSDKNSEMSLDEVLSSIKKMVTDEEPPVLELTDMVKEDGSIVNIKDGTDAKSDPNIASFLKLVQENSENNPITAKLETNTEISPSRLKPPAPSHEKHNYPKLDKDIVLSELVKESVKPLLQEWLNEHLPSIVSKAVEQEIRKLLNKN